MASKKETTSPPKQASAKLAPPKQAPAKPAETARPKKDPGPGVRIFTLAKELGMSSKDLIAFLKTQGHQCASHMSAIPQPVAQILRDRYKPPPKKEERPERVTAGGRQDANGGRRSDSGRSDSGRGPSSVAGPGAHPGGLPPGAGFAGGTDRGRPSTVERWRDRERVEDPVEETGEEIIQEEEGRPEDRKRTAEVAKERRVRRFFPTDEYSSSAGVSRHGVRRKVTRPGRAEPGPSHEARPPSKVEVSLPVTLKDLSSALALKVPVLMKTLFRLGKPATLNQYLDAELVEELCMEFGTEVHFKKKEDDLEATLKALEQYQSSAEDLMPRAPVVTFLGHVDHGKTSLLDKIRQTSVTKTEHGGITQHLGAYRVDKDDVHVTFIDTPGHRAFTEMRARGANVTDVAVLVVAADDGPMPQTEEAINHARAAGVPIVVALNKIDLPTANPRRCKEQLSALGLHPVEWGGQTEYIEVSASTGQGIDRLLETLSLESQILDLKANPTRPAVGVVLEAQATKNRGVLATVLVKDGTLRVGDYVLAWCTHGSVRWLMFNGTDEVKEAGPSIPVTVVGLNFAPEAGDKLFVFDNERQARQLAEERERRRRELEQAEKYSVKKVTLENLVARMAEQGVKELRLILKADVRGSIEALKSSLESLSTDEIKVVILHTGVGAINQEDVNLASASNAVILGFHVVADDRARALAEEEGVDIRYYKVIYEAIEDVKAAMEERLAPEEVEVVHGRAEIRQVFRASKVGNIAGCFVTSGFVLRSDRVRLIRDGKPIYTGSLATLKRFKDDVREVKEGFECGMKIAGYEDIKEGDVIESFVVERRARTL